MLIEIKSLLDGIDVKQTKLTEDLPKLKETFSTASQLERLSVRLLVLFGAGDMNNAMAVLIRMLMLAKILQSTFTTMMNPTTPVGLILSLVSMGAGLLSFGNTLYDSLQGYQ
jgi:hypothetical protein